MCLARKATPRGQRVSTLTLLQPFRPNLSVSLPDAIGFLGERGHDGKERTVNCVNELSRPRVMCLAPRFHYT